MNPASACKTTKINIRVKTYPATTACSCLQPARDGLDNREWRTPNLSGKFARLQPQGRQVSVTLQSCAMD
jgi:hypothetical protein